MDAYFPSAMPFGQINRKTSMNTPPTPPEARRITAEDRPVFPQFVWGYYSNGGHTLNFTFDKEYAERSADGFTWDNPRVRKVGLVKPLKHKTSR